MNNALVESLQKFVTKDNIKEWESMSEYTTFRVGGKARVLIDIQKTSQLVSLIPFLRRLEIPYFILGNGSNLLVGDKGYEGVVIRIGSGMSDITVQGNEIVVQAGALLSKVSKTALEHGLSGLEFASGIPGSIGGAVVMNAGAYDGEMQQVVTQVTVLNTEGNLMELDRETMEFGYRTSVIKNRPFIVLEVKLQLVPKAEKEIRIKMNELAEKRREKQPLEYASAGSTFKRPEGHFAGKLIMDAGLRGYRIGGAQVAEKHCGFIINVGNATANDISELITEVQDRVEEQFGVRLETEVVKLGMF